MNILGRRRHTNGAAQIARDLLLAEYQLPVLVAQGDKLSFVVDVEELLARGLLLLAGHRGPMTSPGGEAKRARRQGDGGGGGIAASRIMRLTSQTDVLGGKFCPKNADVDWTVVQYPPAIVALPSILVKSAWPPLAERRML